MSEIYISAGCAGQAGSGRVVRKGEGRPTNQRVLDTKGRYSKQPSYITSKQVTGAITPYKRTPVLRTARTGKRAIYIGGCGITEWLPNLIQHEMATSTI